MPTEYLCAFSGSVPAQLQTPVLIIGKCVVLILKLPAISKNIKAPAQNMSPELILSSSVHTRSVRDSVHFRHHYPKVLQSLFQTIRKKKKKY